MATYQNITLVYNPAAGRLSRNKGLLQRSIDALRGGGHRVALTPTTGPNSAGALAAKAARSGADLIVAAGGDGTINEVVNGLATLDVPLAILPAGTANVLANEMGIGGRPERAAEMVGELVAQRVALGQIRLGRPAGNGTHSLVSRYFLLMAGVGLDAHIVYHLDLNLKARLGKLSYWLGGFGQIGRQLEEFDVRIGERTYRSSFALVSRVRNYGGDLEIASTATLLDDDFEFVLFEGDNASRYLGYFAGVITRNLRNVDGVHFLRAKKAEFLHPSDKDVYIQVDGEYAGQPPASVEIVPSALTLLMPPKYVAKAARLRANVELAG
ncbi:MAG: diacylglycerol kinase family protein [Bryobacteraceae bacterium]|nr:diacylglycerol kinase family protein [Bryobacteraceae bacterium]